MFFFSHLNGVHPSIQFTMELEANASLPFLDVLVCKNSSQRLSYSVYRKPTHTNCYLHALSHYYPSQLNSVVNTLVSRSIRLSEEPNRHSELNKLRHTLQQNGYDKNQINRSIQRHLAPSRSNNDISTLNDKRAYFPYIKGVTDKIGRVLKPHSIKTVFTTEQKLSNFVRSVKDKPPNENQGVYEIFCQNCPRSYIGQANRRIQTRIYTNTRFPSEIMTQLPHYQITIFRQATP